MKTLRAASELIIRMFPRQVCLYIPHWHIDMRGNTVRRAENVRHKLGNINFLVHLHKPLSELQTLLIWGSLQEKLGQGKADHAHESIGRRDRQADVCRDRQIDEWKDEWTKRGIDRHLDQLVGPWIRIRYDFSKGEQKQKLDLVQHIKCVFTIICIGGSIKGPRRDQ